MPTTLKEKIENLQAKQGLNHTQLARRAGMSRQTLYRVKKSKRPQMKTIRRLTKALNVPADYFFED